MDQSTDTKVCDQLLHPWISQQIRKFVTSFCIHRSVSRYESLRSAFASTDQSTYSIQKIGVSFCIHESVNKYESLGSAFAYMDQSTDTNVWGQLLHPWNSQQIRKFGISFCIHGSVNIHESLGSDFASIDQSTDTKVWDQLLHPWISQQIRKFGISFCIHGSVLSLTSLFLAKMLRFFHVHLSLYNCTGQIESFLVIWPKNGAF